MSAVGVNVGNVGDGHQTCFFFRTSPSGVKCLNLWGKFEHKLQKNNFVSIPASGLFICTCVILNLCLDRGTSPIRSPRQIPEAHFSYQRLQDEWDANTRGSQMLCM